MKHINLTFIIILVLSFLFIAFGDSIKKESGDNTGLLKKKKIEQISMEEVDVHGFLENVTPVYILDFYNDDYKPIRIEKDFIFGPGFMTNIIRENFEWENEYLYYKDSNFKPYREKKEKIK